MMRMALALDGDTLTLTLFMGSKEEADGLMVMIDRAIRQGTFAFQFSGPDLMVFTAPEARSEFDMNKTEGSA